MKRLTDDGADGAAAAGTLAIADNACACGGACARVGAWVGAGGGGARTRIDDAITAALRPLVRAHDWVRVRAHVSPIVRAALRPRR